MAHEDIPQDGGWGWMVVLGAAMINMVNQALFSVYGLIFGEELKEMAGGHATGITLVMSVSVCVTNFSGLAVGPLMKKTSVRTITAVGVLCVGTGMIISSFATQIWHIVVGYGVFTGLGLGLVASSTFLAINDYFTKRKSTAVGLAMAGTSIGQMIMPLFVGILLKKYLFSGTTLILGCLSYSGIIGAFFFKPILCCKPNKVQQKNKTVDVETTLEKTVQSQYDLNSNQSELNNKKSSREESEKLLNKPEIIVIEHKTDNTSPYKETTIRQTNHSSSPKNTFTTIVEYMDLHILKDFKFVHMLIGLGLGYLSTVSFSTFFPMFLQDEVQFSMWETTSCMTALSAADIAGRLTVSEICRKLNLGNRASFMVGAVLLAMARSFLVEMTDYKFVLIGAILTGYFRAVTVINQNLVISEYIQKEKLASAIGLNMVVKGIFVISLGEPLGLLKDAFDYSVCIHLLNIILLVIVCSWTVEMVLYKKRNNDISKNNLSSVIMTENIDENS